MGTRHRDRTVPQTREELVEHLRRQTRLLRTSAAAFDQGDEEDQAPMLAARIRVLVHDTGGSHGSRSLLKQLGVKDRLRFLDSRLSDVLPDLPPPSPGLKRIRLTFGLMGLTSVRLGPPMVRYVAPLGDVLDRDHVRPLAPFGEWWEEPVLEDTLANSFSREDLVLALAHQDGGMHVDPKISAAYAALSRSNSLGWTRGGGPIPRGSPMDSPVPATVRQVAFELDHTLTNQLAGWLA